MTQALEHRKRIANLILELALVGPDQTVEVCEHCGIDRERAEFYREDCRGADAGVATPLGTAPNPVIGDHTYVRVSRAPIARPYSVSRIAQDQRVMMFFGLAQHIPAAHRFADAAAVEQWALHTLANHPRGMNDEVRERGAFVARMMWRAIEEAEDARIVEDHGTLLLDLGIRAQRAYYRAMRVFQAIEPRRQAVAS